MNNSIVMLSKVKVNEEVRNSAVTKHSLYRYLKMKLKLMKYELDE
jgi:hypothetical protein